MDSKIKPSFWSDPKIEALSSSERLAVLWLMTAHVSNCGWATATRGRFEFETGLEWSTLESAALSLGTGLVRSKDGWWVRNFIRHQIGDGSKLAKNNMRAAIKGSMAFAPAEIVAEIMTEYPELGEGLQRPAEGLQKENEGLQNDSEAQEKSRAEKSRGIELEGGAGGNLPDAEKILQAYPRRDAPMHCMGAIQQALDTGEDPKLMLADVEECAKHVKRAPGGADNHWIPSAKTFFLERRWKDVGVFSSRVDELIAKVNGNGLHASPKADTVWSLKQSLDAVNEQITEIDSSVTGAWGNLPPAKAKERLALVERRKELKRKLSGLEERT